MNNSVTWNELVKVLDYNVKTGIFKWKISGGSIRENRIAGSIREDGDGYIEICINGKYYLAHRLAWFYVHGYFPEHGLDHMDRIKHHNGIDNLREATQSCNMRNTGNLKNNTSGVKGVHWHKLAKKWNAKIMVLNKTKHLGLYKDFNNAVCARLAGEQCLDWANCDSSSPAYQYVKGMLKQ